MAISRRFLQPINLLNAATDPSTAEQGDLYYNSASDKIRFYDGAAWQDVGSGGAGVTISETAPEDPETGQGWFKSSISELFFYDGTFWIEATSVVDNFLLFEVGPTSPPGPIEWQGWLNTDDNSFYIYDGTIWQQLTLNIPSVDASLVIVNASTFNGVLSSSDTTVQSALETLDDLDVLPDQSENNGKFLGTDGTTASWQEVVQGSGSGGGIQTDVAISNSWWLGV